MDKERLRKRLLNDTYVSAAAGFGLTILDESRIRNADEEELKQIAKEHGFREEE